MTRAYLSLASSSGDSPGYIREGLERLSEFGHLVENSDLYSTGRARSDPQARRYHAVAVLETHLSPNALKVELRKLDDAHTAAQAGRQDPQPLDVEVLFFRELVRDEARRRLLHSLLRTPPVLVPLADMEPHLRLPPDRRAAKELAAALPASVRDSVTRIVGTAHPRCPRVLDYDDPGGAGTGYDELRPLSEFNQELFEAASQAVGLRSGMKILDVGCGTGRFCSLFAQKGAFVTGLDRSATMLAAARAAIGNTGLPLHYIQSDANAGLPHGAFDAVTFFLSVQYLALTPALWRSLREALSPSGTVAIVTLAHRHFIENEFLTRYFPSIPRIDLARFPSIPQLVRLLRSQGFKDIVQREVSTESTSTGLSLIARVEGKYVSTLHLLDDAEFACGLAAMRNDLSSHDRVRRTLRATIVSARA